MAFAVAATAADDETQIPEPGQFRPDPLGPVRVYTYPDDYETYYGGAEATPRFTFEVDDTDATFTVSSWAYWPYDKEDRPILYPDFVSAHEGFKNDPNVKRVLPSLELIGQRGKFFDEGAYAAAEFRLDDGTPAVPGGRVGFYGRLAAALAGRYGNSSGPAKGAYADAAAYVATGIALARKDAKAPKSLGLPPEIRDRAEHQAQAFIADFPEVSKPFGFYTWNKELRRVWAHRKWFQFPLDTTNENTVAMVLALTGTIQNDAVLQAEYDAVLAAHAGLTNPGELRDCNDVGRVMGDAGAALNDLLAATAALAQDPNGYPSNLDTFCLLPPAATVEEYIWETVGSYLEGDDDLFAFMIDSIEGHKLTLEPGRYAGWYQYQQYAAEACLLLRENAEGSKLEYGSGYRSRLRNAFRVLLTLNRETHVSTARKGVRVAGKGEFIEVNVYPEVSLEPVPTYYLRVARSYGFLQSVLEDNFGSAALGEMRGVREKGKAKDNLVDELADVRDLYYGLYLESCIDIGLAPELDPGEVANPAAAIARAQRWLADWQDDPLIREDIRVIVPVGSEGDNEAEPFLKCWAIVGVEARMYCIKYKYEEGPTCRIVEGDVNEGYAPGDVRFLPSRSSYVILTPSVIEVTIPGSTPLDRDEFRELCDRYDSASEIKEALENREPAGRKLTVVDRKLRELITLE
jgi:hypothetical protein